MLPFEPVIAFGRSSGGHRLNNVDRCALDRTSRAGAGLRAGRSLVALRLHLNVAASDCEGDDEQ